MKKVLFAAMLMLSACTSTGTVTAQSVADFVKANCNGLIVVVADVATLIASQPAGTTVQFFGDEICNAFKAMPASPTANGAGGVIIVNNVPIHYTLK